MNQSTSIWYKLYSSMINITLILFITSPLFLIYGFDTKWKLLTIFTFLLYELILIFTKQKRDLGMIIMGSYWKEPFTNSQYILYNLLYTLSFASLFFYFIFPGDLLLINLLLVQLPFVVLTKYTLHGYLSGMITVVKRSQS